MPILNAPVLNGIVFVAAALFAVGAIIGLAFQMIGFLLAGAIILAAAIWISANLRPKG